VMLRGVNDAEEHARQLGQLLDGLAVTINLIPWNPVLSPDMQFQAPGPERVRSSLLSTPLPEAPAFLMFEAYRPKYATRWCTLSSHTSLTQWRCRVVLAGACVGHPSALSVSFGQSVPGTLLHDGCSLASAGS
jgi:hypothetical protein